MFKKLTSFCAALAITIGLLFPVPVAAGVIDVFPGCKDGNVSQSEICKAQAGGGKLFGAGSIWNNILNVLTIVIGAVSVLMIIIGSFRYTLSQGDQNAINGAKNTIIYSLVGLVLAATANAIVNFVLTAI